MRVLRSIAAFVLTASVVAACSASGGSPGTNAAPGQVPASADTGTVSIGTAMSRQALGQS